MNNYTVFPKNKFYIIISSVAVILFMLSLEVAVIVKDLTLFENWYNTNFIDSIAEEEAYSIYLSSNLGLYIIKILVPMLFGIQTYFAYVKLRINNVYVFVWGVLLFGSFLFIFLGLQLASVLYYIILISYVVLLVTLYTLYFEINRKVNHRKEYESNVK